MKISAQRTNMSKAQKLITKKQGILVDVRDPVAFRDGTVEGAINLSLRQLSTLLRHPKTTPIILYGDDGDAANYLTQFGFKEVFALTETKK